MCKRRFIIDAGKNTVKFMIVSKDGTIERMGSFESKTATVDSFNAVQGGAEHYLFKVEYQGKRYLVGDNAYDKFDQEFTKMNEHHKIIIYTILAYLAEEGEMVYLVTGCPTDEYNNEVKPKEYEDFLKNDSKNIEISVNDIKKNFQIATIEVHTEGMCILPRNILGHGEYRIVDIGGQNVNYRDYNKNGSSTFSFSLDEAGVNYVASYLKTKLNQTIENKETVDLKSIDFQEVLDLGYINNPSIKSITGFKDSRDFVESKSVEFISRRILEPFSENGVKLKANGKKMIFSGGGSLKLRRYLEKAIGDNITNVHFSETAKWDNCFSYLLKSLSDTQTKNSNAQAILKVFRQAENPKLEFEKDPFLRESRQASLEEVATTI